MKKNNPPLLGSGFSVEEEMLGWSVIQAAKGERYQAKP
jgi:hypothetical protein